MNQENDDLDYLYNKYKGRVAIGIGYQEEIIQHEIGFNNLFKPDEGYYYL